MQYKDVKVQEKIEGEMLWKNISEFSTNNSYILLLNHDKIYLDGKKHATYLPYWLQVP